MPDSATSYWLQRCSHRQQPCLWLAVTPEIWAEVSAWAPISDLSACYSQGRYTTDLVNSMRGEPDDSYEIDKEYVVRSPITYLKNVIGVNIHISTGIKDGHEGSVPISHSINIFNELAEFSDRMSKGDLNSLEKEI
jgi:hypothetical protein